MTSLDRVGAWMRLCVPLRPQLDDEPADARDHDTPKQIWDPDVPWNWDDEEEEEEDEPWECGTSTRSGT